MLGEKFGNDGSELLFGASGDSCETASTHYLKVEPIIDAVTYDTTDFRYILFYENLHLWITSNEPTIVFIYILQSGEGGCE